MPAVEPIAINPTPATRMRVQLHRLLACLAIAAGFFGGAAVVRQSISGSWLFLAGAFAGGLLADLIFVFLVPAKCPHCDQRVKCRYQSRSRTAGEAADGFPGTMWFLAYRCPQCDWDSHPRRQGS
jgi:hypothetical protein